jgi:ABC-type multidrug transport system fused ATPase/permease subunit
MLNAVKASLAFMTPKERATWFFLTGLRGFLSFLDLAGILAIGLVVTSTAIFLTSGSDPNRVIDFAGFRLPAVNAESLPYVSIAVLGLFLTKALYSVILTKKAAFFVAQVEARAARTIAEISFGGDLGRVRSRSREELMFAIQAGSPAAFNTILNAVNVFATETMLFLIISVGFIFVNPTATLAAILYFALVSVVIQFFIGSMLDKAGKLSAEGSIRANAAISDLLSVFRELLVLGKREKYIETLYKARVEAAESAARQYYLSGMPRYILEAALLIGIGFFLLAQALTDDLVQSAATVGVFLSGGFRLTAALLPLQSSLLAISSALGPASLAHEILSLSKGKEAKKSIELGKSRPPRGLSATAPIKVVFNDVSFTYPAVTGETLQRISFEVDAGSQVALIGPSGSGKSTIADLMCGVLLPNHGSVKLTQPDILDGELLVPPRVSYVPQRPGLVSGSILQNIALADEFGSENRERATEALEMASLLDFVKTLPNGLDTQLGNMQDGLSGGQLQRLGLARALYTSPGLLIMDEATSALDAESEAEIQKALDQMRRRVTVVLIAHRLNTIQHADQVILIEEGQVRDAGRFKDLVSRNPSVDKLVDLMRIEKN